MRTRTVALLLVLILVFPLQLTAAEENDDTLEVREIWAEFFPDTESTILQWRNIETTQGVLLDQLKMATYEIHRSENGPFFANAITPETLVAEDIPACYMNDLNEVCSGKLHSFVYEPVPGTSTEVSYAIVTVHRDGTRNEAVNVGLSQIPAGHREFVPASVAPELFAAEYDVANQSTVFTWRPACAGNNFYHSLYEHSTPATKSTWDGMDKTLVTNFIPSTASQFTFDWTNQSVDREVYYTLTCFYPAYCDDNGCYSAREDTRLHSANSLTSPVIEDNQAPRYAGSLTAQFNPTESQTVLQWSEVTQPDIGKIRIYHAMSPIVSFEQSGVQVLAELDTTSVEFIHQLSDDWMLTSYYAIGLVDTEGTFRSISSIFQERLVQSLRETYPSQFLSCVSNKTIQHCTLSGTRSALHQWRCTFWTSTSSNPDMTPAWEELTRLNPRTLEHQMNFDELDEAWYALTLQGTWAPPQVPISMTEYFSDKMPFSLYLQNIPEGHGTANESALQATLIYLNSCLVSKTNHWKMETGYS